MLLHWMQTRWSTGEAGGDAGGLFASGCEGFGASMMEAFYHVANGENWDRPAASPCAFEGIRLGDEWLWRNKLTS